MKTIRLMQSIVLASVFLVTLAVAGAARGDPNSPAENENFFKNLPKSVGLVVGEKVSSGPASKRPIGTAFVVSKDGMMLTNAHVVSGQKNLSVFFANGEKMEAHSVQLILSDSFYDVAVLKIFSENKETFEPLSFGDPQELVAGYSDITVAGFSPALGGKGKKLFIGNGKVTQTDVFGDSGGAELGLYMVTSVLGGHGNSGSPCLHKNKVVGIAAAIKVSSNSEATGPIMCISAILAKQALTKVIAGGSIMVHGRMNVDLTQFPPNLVKELDQYVYPFPEEPPLVAVVNGYNSGLRPVDRIIALTFQKEEKESTAYVFSIADFRRIIGNLSPGTFITATIVRAGEKMALRLLVEGPPENNQPH